MESARKSLPLLRKGELQKLDNLLQFVEAKTEKRYLFLSDLWHL